MADKAGFGVELEMVKKAFSDIFSGRALVWQLGGTIGHHRCAAVGNIR